MRIKTAAEMHDHTGQRDEGFTLVEYLVAMGIFGVVIGLLVAAVATMSISVRKADNLATATDAARVAFARFDKQVRYASAINRPVEVGSDWYVEFATTDGAGAAVCRQWRLVASTDLLQTRYWSGTPTSTPAWSTIASHVVNDPTATVPFTFTPASSTVPHQILDVTLQVRAGVLSTATVTMKTSLAARNAGSDAVTNADDNGNGVSDTQVCQEVSRS